MSWIHRGSVLALWGALTAGLAVAADDARSVTPARQLARQLNQAFVEVADEVSPAVVVIDVAQREEAAEGDAGANPWLDLLPEEWRDRFRRERSEETRRPRARPEFDGQGSGMILDPEGHILTNDHVVENAERLRIRLKDGRQFEAEVRGRDPQSDLAVLQLKNGPHDLPVVRLGDSDRLRVGEFAIAIGAPFRLDYTITFGHVSAKGRNAVVPAMMGGRMMDQDFIQTDANINPGNSGGPLVNIEGEVIGVNSIIRGLNSGIGFAIPVNLAKEISARLIADGKFSRAWLGIGIEALRDVDEVKASVPGLTDGVVIMDLKAGGPALKAEPALEPSDVITAVDGHAVNNPSELRAQVSRKTPGKVVILDVRRAEQSLKIQVTPQAMPERFPPLARREQRPAEEPEARFLGMKVKSLSAAESKEASVEGGIVVLDIEEDSLAKARGIQTGDIITEINHRAISSTTQLSDAIGSANLKRGVLLNLTRDGKSSFLVLKERDE